MTITTYKLYRKSDPDTSREAIDGMTASGERVTQSKIVLASVIDNPGMTAGEIASRAALKRGTPAALKRLNDLRLAGLVEKGEPRRCTIDMTNQITWFAVKQNEEPVQGTLL